MGVDDVVAFVSGLVTVYGFFQNGIGDFLGSVVLINANEGPFPAVCLGHDLGIHDLAVCQQVDGDGFGTDAVLIIVVDPGLRAGDRNGFGIVYNDQRLLGLGIGLFVMLAFLDLKPEAEGLGNIGGMGPFRNSDQSLNLVDPIMCQEDVNTVLQILDTFNAKGERCIHIFGKLQVLDNVTAILDRNTIIGSALGVRTCQTSDNLNGVAVFVCVGQMDQQIILSILSIIQFKAEIRQIDIVLGISHLVLDVEYHVMGKGVLVQNCGRRLFLIQVGEPVVQSGHSRHTGNIVTMVRLLRASVAVTVGYISHQVTVSAILDTQASVGICPNRSLCHIQRLTAGQPVEDLFRQCYGFRNVFARFILVGDLNLIVDLTLLQRGNELRLELCKAACWQSCCFCRSVRRAMQSIFRKGGSWRC